MVMVTVAITGGRYPITDIPAMATGITPARSSCATGTIVRGLRLDQAIRRLEKEPTEMRTLEERMIAQKDQGVSADPDQWQSALKDRNGLKGLTELNVRRDPKEQKDLNVWNARREQKDQRMTDPQEWKGLKGCHLRIGAPTPHRREEDIAAEATDQRDQPEAAKRYLS